MMAKRGIIDMVSANLKVPRGNAGYWAVMRSLDRDGPFTLNMVHDGTNGARESIRDYVKRLVKAGYVEKVGSTPQGGTGKVPAVTYRLIKAPLVAPRLDRDGEVLGEPQSETLWRAMKMLGTFTAGELQRSTEDITVSRIVEYMRSLAEAGVIAKTSDGPIVKATFRLVLNVGALAPVVTKAKVVFDPNSKVVLGSPQLVEVAP